MSKRINKGNWRTHLMRIICLVDLQELDPMDAYKQILKLLKEKEEINGN